MIVLISECFKLWFGLCRSVFSVFSFISFNSVQIFKGVFLYTIENFNGFEGFLGVGFSRKNTYFISLLINNVIIRVNKRIIIPANIGFLKNSMVSFIFSFQYYVFYLHFWLFLRFLNCCKYGFYNTCNTVFFTCFDCFL